MRKAIDHNMINPGPSGKMSYTLIYQKKSLPIIIAMHIDHK